jgi:hypothetical protein
MSKEQHKRIAHIFEEEQVFLTKNGCFYGYENIDGTFKCHRLNTLEIRRFLYRIKDVKKDIMLLSPTKGVKRRLPRKYEDVTPFEI